MTKTDLTFTGTVVLETCWCGIRHGVPKQLRDYMKGQHANGETQQGIYCPLGHSWIYSGQSEAERLRAEKERLERVASARAESLRIVREERDHAEKQARAYKMVAAKARKRAQAAVCPVDGCGRSFVQLRRHLDAKHPDFVSAPPPDEAAQPS